MVNKIITEAQVTALINYLKKRPFEEVCIGIAELTNLPDAPIVMPAVVEKKEEETV